MPKANFFLLKDQIKLPIRFFWGCPSLRLGRAVPGLAGLLGPAGFFASLQKPLVCGFAAPLSIPQPAGLTAL